MSEFVSLFDLSDNNKKEIRTIQEELVAIKTSIKKNMDSGLSPEVMNVAKGLYSAAQAAITYVENR